MAGPRRAVAAWWTPGAGPPGRDRQGVGGDPDSPHGPPECPTRPDRGEGQGLLCGLNAHLGSFRHSPARGMAAVFTSTTCSRPERKDTTSPFLPLNFRCRMEIGLEINFKTKRKGPLWGLKLLKSFGGRWATRTPGLWFRRPTLYPPELIARAKKFYQMHPPCQGNPEPGKEAGPGRRNRPAGLSAWQIFAAADLVAPEARPGGRPRSGADHRTGY